MLVEFRTLCGCVQMLDIRPSARGELPESIELALRAPDTLDPGPAPVHLTRRFDLREYRAEGKRISVYFERFRP